MRVAAQPAAASGSLSQGLTEAEAWRLLAEHGSNELPSRNRPSYVPIAASRIRPAVALRMTD